MLIYELILRFLEDKLLRLDETPLSDIISVAIKVFSFRLRGIWYAALIDLYAGLVSGLS